MNSSSIVAGALSLCVLLASPCLAQQPNHRGQQQAHPDNRNNGQRSQAQERRSQRQDQHYYNGRWVDSTEWQRHGAEQDRWTSRNQQRQRRNSDGPNLLSGIIGFALGAAIVGSQQQVQHAQTADDGWDRRCEGKYRSYDRSSRTYLGYDGDRHYCQ